jgi:hypothetical protein
LANKWISLPWGSTKPFGVETFTSNMCIVVFFNLSNPQTYHTEGKTRYATLVTYSHLPWPYRPLHSYYYKCNGRYANISGLINYRYTKIRKLVYKVHKVIKYRNCFAVCYAGLRWKNDH